jgi:aryl-alcohol dehydrogenase-like predicted oxidoreductase
MQRRELGTSGLDISTIGLGSWAIGGWMWGGQDDAASENCPIHAAVDHGVNWIDTAPTRGPLQTIVGRALKALLVTAASRVHQVRRAPTRRSARAPAAPTCSASATLSPSRRRPHRPVPVALARAQPIAETGACDDLLKAKIRAIGVSNFSVAQLDEWMATGVPLHSDQPPFSILRPAAAEDVLPWCAAHDVAAISYSPLFRGMLFGTWSRDKTFGADDARGPHKDYSGPRFQRHLDAVEELQAIARSGGLSCAQLCVGVLLETPGHRRDLRCARCPSSALVANLGVTITAAQSRQVWAVADRLRDLETL